TGRKSESPLAQSDLRRKSVTLRRKGGHGDQNDGDRGGRPQPSLDPQTGDVRLCRSRVGTEGERDHGPGSSHQPQGEKGDGDARQPAEETRTARDRDGNWRRPTASKSFQGCLRMNSSSSAI